MTRTTCALALAAPRPRRESYACPVSRLAVVTGTSRGLGRATVIELCGRGWEVIAVSRAASGASPLPARATELVTDIGTGGGVEAIARTVDGRPLDLLVNNAASGAPMVDLARVDPGDLAAVFDVNVGAPFRLIQRLLPDLQRAPDALILNVSSRLASLAAQADGRFTHLPSSYPYRISKAALNMLTVCVANELAGRVRCWAVHPGALMTDMGLADAAKPAEQAAQELVDVVERNDASSLRFLALGSEDLAW